MKRLFFCLAAGILCAGLFIGCSPKKDAEPAPLRAGYIIRDTLTGVPCCVYLPDNYEARVAKNKEIFPVLYLQHGMYGNEDDWKTQGHLVFWMGNLLAAGEIKEMVVIMPDNCPHRDSDEEEKKNAMTGQWERNFPAFMAEAEAKYRISNNPSQRAIAGLSMGGFHTMHVSHHLGGQFAYVGLFSPATIPTDPNEIYDNWEEEVRQQMKTTTLYWIGIGKDDFLYDFVAEYRRWLETNHLEYTYYESAGGHTWDNWQDYICRFMKKLFR